MRWIMFWFWHRHSYMWLGLFPVNAEGQKGWPRLAGAFWHFTSCGSAGLTFINSKSPDTIAESGCFLWGPYPMLSPSPRMTPVHNIDFSHRFHQSTLKCGLKDWWVESIPENQWTSRCRFWWNLHQPKSVGWVFSKTRCYNLNMQRNFLSSPQHFFSEWINRKQFPQQAKAMIWGLSVAKFFSTATTHWFFTLLTSYCEPFVEIVISIIEASDWKRMDAEKPWQCMV